MRVIERLAAWLLSRRRTPRDLDLHEIGFRQASGG